MPDLYQRKARRQKIEKGEKKKKRGKQEDRGWRKVKRKVTHEVLKIDKNMMDALHKLKNDHQPKYYSE